MSDPRGAGRADYYPAVRSYPVPTVAIEDGAGSFVTINECDFDAQSMTLYRPKAEKDVRPKGSKSKASE